MKIALNGATTMHADLETDIKAASEAGFELIEIWAAKLREFLKTRTTADLKTLLTENNIEPYSINSIEHITFRTAEDYAQIKAETAELTSIAGEIGCPYIVVVPGKLPENASKENIIEESVKVLNELGEIAVRCRCLNRPLVRPAPTRMSQPAISAPAPIGSRAARPARARYVRAASGGRAHAGVARAHDTRGARRSPCRRTPRWRSRGA